jgi:hypothetical protein
MSTFIPPIGDVSGAARRGGLPCLTERVRRFPSRRAAACAVAGDECLPKDTSTGTALTCTAPAVRRRCRKRQCKCPPCGEGTTTQRSVP